MKRLTYLFVLFLLLGVAPGASAGPTEEVAEVAGRVGKAYAGGNLEALMANYADNAVLVSARSAFRVEGKEAIQGYFAELFERYPTRSGFSRHVSARVYGNDTVVVRNGYFHLKFVDLTGQVTDLFTRFSQTWVKVADQWQIVDFHVSRVP